MKKHPFKKRVGTQTKTNSKPAPKEEKELNRASSLASIESYQEFVPKGPITIPTVPKEEQEDTTSATKPKTTKNNRNRNRKANRNTNTSNKTEKNVPANSINQNEENPSDQKSPSKPKKTQTSTNESVDLSSEVQVQNQPLRKPRKPRSKNPKTQATFIPAEPTESKQDTQAKQGKQKPRNKSNKNPRILRCDSVASDMSIASNFSSYSTSSSDLPLREKLERELLKQTYLCPICMDSVKHHQLIWSCHGCYCIIHLQCMKRWIFQNLDPITLSSLPKLAKDPAKFLSYLHNHGTAAVLTRCPVCRSEQQVPCILSGCFCGNGMINKKNDDDLMPDSVSPHCCGKLCGRDRGNGCTHPCNLLCHPGPCPACSAIITLPCQCGRSQQNVRCGTDPSSIHCDEVCGKLLDCKEHTCQLVCHSGPCPSCSIPVECKCYCGAEKKVMNCGDTKMAMCPRNPPYDPDLMIETKAVASEGQVNANLYNNEDILGDLDGLSDLSDSEEEDNQEVQSSQPVVEEKAVKPFKYLTIREVGIGAYSCGHVCGKVLPCQRHRCNKICHANDCGLCPLTVTETTTCPCGKHLAREINPSWHSCADPFPCCGEVCGKTLACSIHTCPYKCHIGPCPTCEVPCPQKCRCTFTEREVPCWVIHNLPAPEGISKEKEEELRKPFICTRVCKTDLNCHRHKCEEVCCPYKGKKSDGTFHICNRPCGKVLNCGIHTCYLPCHTGDCVPCGHISNTPVTCACGKQVIKPPVPCGTPPPKCTAPCMKPCPRGHVTGNHTCHFGPCPPCVVLTDRMCEGGHCIVKGVPCYREKVFCNRICGKTLPCGHLCQRTCHEPPCIDEKECLEHGCGQICGKKREFCEHTCQAPCHPGQPCPNLPCMFDVVVHCPCGRRTETQKCLIGVSGDEAVIQDLNNRSLECDSECKIIQRNRRLAEALNVGPAKLNLSESELTRAYEVELQNCPYSKATLCTANLSPEFVTWIETACDAIVRSSQPQPITVPHHLTSSFAAIEDVVKEYGITAVRKNSSIILTPSESMKHPGILLSEALVRFESLIDGNRLHPAQPLPKYATERDFATLYIHNRRGNCKNDRDLLDYLQSYLPTNQYKIKTWLRPDGLLILFSTEEIARRVKQDLEMRDAEFDVDFWAVHPEEKKKNEEKEEEKNVIEPQIMKKEAETFSTSNSYSALSEE